MNREAQNHAENKTGGWLVREGDERKRRRELQKSQRHDVLPLLNHEPRSLDFLVFVSSCSRLFVTDERQKTK